MKNKISKAAAALALAAAAVFAAPAVANAYTPVAPGGAVTVAPGGTVTIAPGGPVTLFVNVSALPDSDTSVTFTLSGEGITGASLARIAASADASTSVTKPVSNPEAVVTLPEDASGTYTLATEGTPSGTDLDPITIRVAATGGDVDGGVLPVNGFDSDQLLGIWVGGGVLVLAGASIAVATSVRRSRQAA
ncbi:hypothetical protein BKA24_000806 [Microbacterium marinum]|uniref:Sortase n=1 Tax=Microbacterium marinum TaxID=421115 RepID=A0A7W7FHJ1_9MICO|nr:hypothetical protein [Microbacterium marinum]MBB4666097.1 hypothetical protein [Microbacterium marinum]